MRSDDVKRYLKHTRRERNIDLHWKEILSGSGVSFVLKFAGMAFNYLFIFMISRLYGADAFGAVSLTIVLLNIMALAGRFGIESVWLRFFAEYASVGRRDLIKGLYQKSLKLILPFSLMLSLMLYVFSGHLAQYVFHKVSLTAYFKIGALAVVPLVMVSLHSQAIRAMKRIALYSFYQYIVHFFFACMFMGILTLLMRNHLVPVLAYALALSAGALLSYLSWKRVVAYENAPAIEQMTINAVMKIAIPMLISSSLSLFLGWTDTLLLGIYRTEQEVGLYSVCLKIAMVVTFPLTAISSIVAPKFSESFARGDLNDLRSVIRRASMLNFWFSFPLFLAIVLLPGRLLGLFGSEFKEGLVPLLILVVGQFINALTGPVAFVLQMTGREQFLRNVIVISTVINVVANILLIPRLGTTGAAIANMMSVAFWNLAAMFYIRRYLKVSTLYVPLIQKIS